MRPSKKKAMEDKDIFMQEIKDLEKELENMENMRINNRIFSVRKKKILEERNQEVSAMEDKDGNMANTRQGMIDVLMEYNEDLLNRKEHPADFKEIFELKKEMMDMINVTDFHKYETITPEEFEEVVKKIEKKNKAMYTDFIQSGPEFKRLIFLITKKIYETEEIPESFLITTLIPLFKKGNPRDQLPITATFT